MKLNQPQKLIAKVGTDTMTTEGGVLNMDSIRNFSDQMAAFMRAQVHCLLVSSGAMAAGREVHPDTAGLDAQSRKQVLTTIGQPRLIAAYSKALEHHDMVAAQVLLVKDNFESRTHRRNMNDPLRYEFSSDSILPVANENDLVSVTGLKFTDNDELTDELAEMLEPDTIFLLTSTDGLFEDDPRKGDHVGFINEIDPTSFNLDAVNFGDGSANGTGGMKSKVERGMRMAMRGAQVIIANGTRDNIMHRSIAGDQGLRYTYIKPVRST